MGENIEERNEFIFHGYNIGIDIFNIIVVSVSSQKSQRSNGDRLLV